MALNKFQVSYSNELATCISKVLTWTSKNITHLILNIKDQEDKWTHVRVHIEVFCFESPTYIGTTQKVKF